MKDTEHIKLLGYCMLNGCPQALVLEEAWRTSYFGWVLNDQVQWSDCSSLVVPDGITLCTQRHFRCGTSDNVLNPEPVQGAS